MLHKMSIAGIAMDPASKTPIILLKSDDDDDQVVPIWIGLLEATSIASAMKNIKFDRPMTHDLFKNFADRMKIGVTRVEVSDIKDNTYYAIIHFDSPEGTFEMDARPSDAIAIALRYDAPVYVDERVIAKSRDTAPDAELGDES